MPACLPVTIVTILNFCIITGSDTWGSGSVVWQSPNPGNNLWTPLDGTTERGTPSSLNSFLPESLLGAELN